VWAKGRMNNLSAAAWPDATRQPSEGETHRLALMSWILTALMPRTSAQCSGFSIWANFSSLRVICSIMVDEASSRISLRNLTVPLRVDMPRTGGKAGEAVQSAHMMRGASKSERASETDPCQS
jgi:hypothetical protein